MSERLMDFEQRDIVSTWKYGDSNQQFFWFGVNMENTSQQQQICFWPCDLASNYLL